MEGRFNGSLESMKCVWSVYVATFIRVRNIRPRYVTLIEKATKHAALRQSGRFGVAVKISDSDLRILSFGILPSLARIKPRTPSMNTRDLKL